MPFATCHKDERPAALRGFAAGLLVLVFVLMSWADGASAETRDVTPADGALQGVLSLAVPGDVIRLASGLYAGPLVIDRPISLVAAETPGDVVIEGNGQGSVIHVTAPGVVLRGLTVRNSGIDLSTEDSGIFLDRDSEGALVEDNTLEGNLIGIYLKGAKNAVVRGNRITGRQDLRVNERGNGIHIWNAPGSLIEGNDVRFGRDGIFVTTSHHNAFRDNRFSELRFAVHYMYTNDSEISGNVSRGNTIGYALMYSHHLSVSDNLSDGDRDHGFLMNYANSSDISGNHVRGGTEKCVFIYNANKNSFHRNRFEGCGIGIHFTAGSERNRISENAFLDNRTQVKYVGTRHIEWSHAGRGNYWSDNSAFDLDGDGLADQPYRPNDLVDQVIWRHPTAKLLLNSPALQVLRWAQSAFPTLYPGGVMDSAPLMSPPLGQKFAASRPGEG